MFAHPSLRGQLWPFIDSARRIQAVSRRIGFRFKFKKAALGAAERSEPARTIIASLVRVGVGKSLSRRAAIGRRGNWPRASSSGRTESSRPLHGSGWERGKRDLARSQLRENESNRAESRPIVCPAAAAAPSRQVLYSVQYTRLTTQYTRRRRRRDGHETRDSEKERASGGQQVGAESR